MPHQRFQRFDFLCHSVFSGQFVCLRFYSLSTVFQLFNGDNSQIHFFLDYFLTRTKPVHYPDTGEPVVVLFP